MKAPVAPARRAEMKKLLLGSDAVHVRGDVPGLGAVAVSAAGGETVVRSTA